MSQPTITLIAAMDRKRAIGYNKQLPWHMPADLKFFKNKTLNKPLIMGRKTFESMGHPLANRRNIVVTRDETYDPEAECEVYHDLTSAIEAANNDTEIMILGGADIFKQALTFSDRMYLTYIDAEFKADTYFPAWNSDEWKEIAREDHEADDRNPYPYTFVTLERRKQD